MIGLFDSTSSSSSSGHCSLHCQLVASGGDYQVAAPAQPSLMMVVTFKYPDYPPSDWPEDECGTDVFRDNSVPFWHATTTIHDVYGMPGDR